jgi:NAD(P)-dependent dehydrogenase (short-subunit alcohol dehydrogenase family)
LGRCIAVDRGRKGDRVALLARRKDLLDEAAVEAGSDSFAVRCDVTDESSCRDAVAEAVGTLGGLDALVYTTAVGLLQRIEDVDAAAWRRAFETNVIGASLITATAVPHLEETSGVAAYLSTVQGMLTPPWPGLGSYAVSKAALEKLVEAWRAEHPKVGFTRVSVGECAGGDGPAMTQFANDWDQDLAAEVMPTWLDRHYMTGLLIDVEELLRVMDTVLSLTAAASIPTVTVMPRHQ